MKIFILKFFSLVSCFLLVTACHDNSFDNNVASTNIRDNLLVYCSEASPQSFNPQLVTSGTTFDASAKPIYNRLVDFKKGTSLIEPSLATSWTVSNDGTEYVFNLREGVAFHQTEYFTPTRNFNADDVIFSFLKQKDSKHPFHKTSNLGYRYFRSMGFDSLIKKIEKINDYTIKFTLKHAESPFVSILAMDFASILSAEYASNLLAMGMQTQIDHLPIGTGPFQFVKYNPDAIIRYRSHPNYWKGEEKLKELVFAITPNPSLRFARLIAGECDVMAKPLPIHVRNSQNYSDIVTHSEPGSNIAYLSMNTRKKPFDNPEIRRAINLAIDKKRLLQIVYDNSAISAKNPIPPNMWSFNDDIKEIEYSQSKAIEILNRQGFKNGFKMELWAMPVQRTYNPNARKMAELIQKDLEKVGIQVNIVSYDFGTFLEKTKNGEHQTALLGWIGDNGDPDNFFSSLLSCTAAQSGSNASFWCHPEFENLIDQARKITPQNQRSELYKKAQVIFNKEIPWVPIAHAKQFVLVNKRVNNFSLMPTDGIYFNSVYLQPVKTPEQNVLN